MTTVDAPPRLRPCQRPGCRGSYIWCASTEVVCCSLCGRPPALPARRKSGAIRPLTMLRGPAQTGSTRVRGPTLRQEGSRSH